MSIIIGRAAHAGTDAAGARPRVRGAGDVLHVVVAGDAPHLAGGVPVDGRVVAHPREGLVGIARPELTGDQIDVGVGGMVGPAGHGREV